MTPPSSPSDKTRERIQARRSKRKGKKGGSDAPPTAATTELGKKKDDHRPEPFTRVLRGWADALFFAFVLAMFIRTYVFELFMIPTGSMTSSLIGDDAGMVRELDWDGDGDEDIVVDQNAVVNQFGSRDQFVAPLHIFLRDEQGRLDDLILLVAGDRSAITEAYEATDPPYKSRGRRDMILVNKFAYWFTPPDRGDIVVFKTPDRADRGAAFAFDPEKPVYIKRAVGLPGEEITLQPVSDYIAHSPSDPGRVTPPEFGGREQIMVSQPVLVDGQPLTAPPFDRLTDRKSVV